MFIRSAPPQPAEGSLHSGVSSSFSRSPVAAAHVTFGARVTDSSHFNPDRPMNKGLIWTIVGILLIIALIIWISRAV